MFIISDLTIVVEPEDESEDSSSGEYIEVRKSEGNVRPLNQGMLSTYWSVLKVVRYHLHSLKYTERKSEVLFRELHNCLLIVFHKKRGT